MSERTLKDAILAILAHQISGMRITRTTEIFGFCFLDLLVYV